MCLCVCVFLFLFLFLCRSLSFSRLRVGVPAHTVPFINPESLGQQRSTTRCTRSKHRQGAREGCLRGVPSHGTRSAGGGALAP
ncbi:hypothetical protein T484DRAFT_3263565 [Baffinella frigidus]|nr:hypothetical protein T484DRAFT_3263565 [Cryptophyta sp. CCMP2293]